MTATTPRNGSGFTLIEIVIAVTIIAMIAGAVLVGRTLIRNAELQSVIADVNKYKNAAKLFRDKYKYLPGDFPRAAEFWGAYAGCPDPGATSERTVKTCDGNGDGFISSTTSTPLSISGGGLCEVCRLEPLRVWQHLSNGGFINSQYSGAFAELGGIELGLNQPKGSVTNSGFSLHYSMPLVPGQLNGAYGNKYGHIIVFGGPEPPPTCAGFSCSFPGNKPSLWPAITSPDAREIDRKVDDGKPGTGNVLSYTPIMTETPLCATSASEATAEYSINSDSRRTCSLIFKTGL